MKKEISIVSVLIITVLVAIIVTLGCILYFSNSSNKNVENGDEKLTNGTKNNNLKDGEYDLDKASALLNEYGFSYNININENMAFPDYSENFKIFYSIQLVFMESAALKNCSELYSNYDASIGMYVTRDNYLCDDTTYVISYEDVNKVYKNLYGKDMNKISASYMLTNYSYNAELNSYVELNKWGGYEETKKYKIYKVKSANIKSNKLYIQVYYQSNSLTYDPSNENEIVKADINGKKVDLVSVKKIDTISNDDLNDLVKDYYEYADVYEIVFNISNDNFTFESITKK